jgi:hypothetical protein
LKFRKKPIVIEATQWFKHGDHSDVRKTHYMEIPECDLNFNSWEALGVIDTLEGKHIVSPGDWIITGIKGEKYPCKPDIFEATYEYLED